MTEIEELRQHVTDLEAMLDHASETIGRLEGRWRAPGAARAGTRAVMIEQGEPRPMVGVCLADGGMWMTPESFEVEILAWHELPPIPSAEGFQELI